MKLNVYKGIDPVGVFLDPSYVIASFYIDEKTIFIQKFFGENYVHVETTVRKPLNITIGDYIKYNGMKYYINTIPEAFKNSTNQYVYIINFESEYYNFAKVQYRLDDQSDFYLMGNLDTFIDLLITNINRVYPTWTKGTYTQTNQEYKLLKFDVENCRTVMQRICTEFNGEFFFARRVISFADTFEHDTELVFEYKSGLKNIQRLPLQSANIITRLYAFGSTKNIDITSYGKLRLELNAGYINSNTEVYGVIEGSTIFEDIYPRRTGTVTSTSSITMFLDSAIDFNVNSYLIPGMRAKINFLTGNCAGYTFDISQFTWNNPGGIFTIIPVQLEDGSELPNETQYPDVTDTYVLIDITMPASYVTAAEAELLALAQTYLDTYDHPRVAYQLTPDWRYMKTNNVNLTIGDAITIEDADLGINVNVRITELTQQLIEPYKYALILSDQYKDNYLSSAQLLILEAYKKANESAGKIAVSQVRDITKTRRNWRDNEELRTMVFDADGYFTESIKPLSIETVSLAAGSKSGYFELNGIVIKPNYLGNNNKLTITGGILTHFAIDNTGGDEIGSWTLQVNTDYEAGGLTTGTAYYLYAKCHKTDYADAGNQIIVSNTAYKADQSSYWYFLVGILHSTTGSVPRSISLTYGMTLINGGFITTGKIQSASGTTYFDLDNNTLVIGSASGYSNISDKPTQLSTINAGEGSKLSGIATGATVGATWGTNLNSIPSRFADTASDNSLAITGTFLGFHATGANWPIKIQNDSGVGKFYVGDGDEIFVDWNGSALTVQGLLRTAASEQRIELDNSDNTLRFYNSANINVITIDDLISGSSRPGMFIGSVAGGYVNVSNNILGESSDTYVELYEGLVEIYRPAADTGHGLNVRQGATIKFYVTADGYVNAAAGYRIGGVAGANFNGAITNLTVVNGIVTAAS